MFDLPYILTHPLIRQIYQRSAELQEEATSLPEGSEERRGLEERISQLEQYRLPKTGPSDRPSEPIFNQRGEKIGERHSLRRRFKEKRRGRPEEYRIKVRAALEEKCANPELTWARLAQKYGFSDQAELRRAVRRLKAVLRLEGISLPPASAYPPLEK